MFIDLTIRVLMLCHPAQSKTQSTTGSFKDSCISQYADPECHLFTIDIHGLLHLVLNLLAAYLQVVSYAARFDAD